MNSQVEEFDFPKKHVNGQHSVIIRDPQHGVLRRFFNEEADAMFELSHGALDAKTRQTLLDARAVLEKTRKGRIIVSETDLKVLAVM